ncbi:MAG: hypothetical protein QF704_05110 [Anaerolineales bacterium]|nr:hypothetical protein [Anaerolineales bacterium]
MEKIIFFATGALIASEAGGARIDVFGGISITTCFTVTRTGTFQHVFFRLSIYTSVFSIFLQFFTSNRTSTWTCDATAIKIAS